MSDVISSDLLPDELIINFVAKSSNIEITDFTQEHTINRIIDTIGVALAGSSEDSIRPMVALAKKFEGANQCRIPFMGLNVSAPTTAWILGASAHALDFDDTHDQLNHIHSGAPVISAAIAAAEAYGPISGKIFIKAVTIGQEVACRLSKVAYKDLGWHRTSLFGSFGAAAACALILNLNRSEVESAFGIVLSHASGTRQSVEYGGSTKIIQAGKAAVDGLTAALLAKEGIIGPRHALTGKFGLFPMYHNDKFNFKNALDGLGSTWLTDTISLKPFPCIRQAHSLIEAAFKARSLNNEMVDNIIGVTIYTNSDVYLPGLSTVTDVIENKYYVPFLVACGISEGQCGLNQLAQTPSLRIERISRLVKWKPDNNAQNGWAKIVLKIEGGPDVVTEVHNPFGSPLRRLSNKMIKDKFMQCAKNSYNSIPDNCALSVFDFLKKLEFQDDSVNWLKEL